MVVVAVVAVVVAAAAAAAVVLVFFVIVLVVVVLVVAPVVVAAPSNKSRRSRSINSSCGRRKSLYFPHGSGLRDVKNFLISAEQGLCPFMFLGFSHKLAGRPGPNLDLDPKPI